MGGGANSQQNSSDQYYQQEANQGNQLFNQYETDFMPQMMKLMPLLMGTINGQSNALTQSAQAPVNAATSRSLNTMQNNAGGYSNMDALASDIALNGQQNAGLASDNLMDGSIANLLSMFGMGQQGAGMGMGGLNNAAGGEANLGAQINQQNNAWWQSLLGAAGAGAGMAFGPKMQGASTNSSTMPNTSGFSPVTAAQMYNPYAMMAGGITTGQPGMSVNSNNQSTPISSNNSGLYSGVGPQP